MKLEGRILRDSRVPEIGVLMGYCDWDGDDNYIKGKCAYFPLSNLSKYNKIVEAVTADPKFLVPANEFLNYYEILTNADKIKDFSEGTWKSVQEELL